MTNEKIFGVYIRVSTERQALEGDSVEMQENLAKEIIKKEGGILYKIYNEPGVSASKTKMKDRPALMECLNDIESGLINHLIVYRRDRLARSSEDSIIIRNKLKEANCEVIFSASGEQQMDLDDIYSPVIENLRAALDEVESAQTSIRVSDTMIDKAKRGEFSGGNVTYGYQNVDGHLKPIESEIDVIKEVEDLYLQGHGVHTICNWLNGVKTKALGKRSSVPVKLKQHKRSSSNWTKETVEAILFNPTYSGYMLYRSKKNPELEPIIVKSDYITPIRTPEKQQEINRLRKKKRDKIHPPRRYNTPFLLTGILTCEECGSDFISRSSQRKDGERYSYYICRNRNAPHKGKCRSKSYKKEVLETHVLSQAKKYVEEFINSDVYEIVQNNLTNIESGLSDELKDVEKKLAKTQKDFQAIRRLLLELDTEDEHYEMMRDAYQDDQKSLLIKLNDLKKAKMNIESRMEVQEEKVVDIDSIIQIANDFESSIDNAPPNLQKKLIEELFEYVSVDANGEVRIKLAISVEEKVKDIEVDFISLGGVGDTTTPKGIKITMADKARQSNIHEWVLDISETVRETFYPFIVSIDPEITSASHFAKKTGLSLYTHKSYRKRYHTPTQESIEQIFANLNIEMNDYLHYLKTQKYDLTEKEINIALETQGRFRRDYNEKLTGYNRKKEKQAGIK